MFFLTSIYFLIARTLFYLKVSHLLIPYNYWSLFSSFKSCALLCAVTYFSWIWLFSYFDLFYCSYFHCSAYPIFFFIITYSPMNLLFSIIGTTKSGSFIQSSTVFSKLITTGFFFLLCISIGAFSTLSLGKLIVILIFYTWLCKSVSASCKLM